MTPFTLYGIKGLDYDAVIATYRRLCVDGVREIDSDSLSVYSDSELQYIEKKSPRKPLKDDTRILRKARFIVHSIAYRQQTQQDTETDGVSIQMSVLQSVIGRDALELITALVELGYISRTPVYILGQATRRYKVNGSIVGEECADYTISKYIQNTQRALNDNIAKRLSSPQFVEEYGDGFAATYIKNLNRFRIADKEGFDTYAERRIKEEPTTKPYLDYIRTSFDNRLKIFKIDDNHRIYHILTSLKRELKKYINIKFSIDCSNSHPLLFNYFIFMDKGISVSSSYKITETLSDESVEITVPSTPNSPYDIKKLRKILIDRGIKNEELAKISDDELLYIFNTTRGVFWEEAWKRHKGEVHDRTDIKKKMFAEVFYSKTKRDSWKVFAQEFKAEYPTVYDLILRWKEPLKDPALKKVLIRRSKAVEMGGRAWMKSEATALPNIMMDLESVIFREILQTLFAKRICAVHIHDAIVIPDVKSTAKLEPSVVEDVMRGVYRKFGLHPSFKVEKYG